MIWIPTIEAFTSEKPIWNLFSVALRFGRFYDGISVDFFINSYESSTAAIIF